QPSLRSERHRPNDLFSRIAICRRRSPDYLWCDGFGSISPLDLTSSNKTIRRIVEMNNYLRRTFLRSSSLSSVGLFERMLNSNAAEIGASSLKTTNVRIEDLSFSYEEFLYRAPYKFGGVPVDRATILNVNVTVRTRDGRTAKGFGSMPLGNVWSFPSREMS